MKFSQREEIIFKDSFDLNLNHIVSSLSDYRSYMINLLKETEQDYTVDDIVFSELAEKAVMFKAYVLISDLEKEIKGKEDALNKYKDLLGL